MNSARFPRRVLALSLVLSGCGESSSDPDIVARAGDHTLAVEDVVQLLADEEQLPARADVVERVADLWIDYALLAQSAERDSTLSRLDFGSLIRAQTEQLMLMALRDSSLQLDTLVTDEDLRERYEAGGSDPRFRARHIMLRYPLQATAAQRDSVRDRLEEIRSRAIQGEDFSELARTFSQDPGSASQGGDLGSFGLGDMVRPFEEAVRSLEPGETSEVVETPMGLHLIRLDEREAPAFDSVADELRTRILAERAQVAESVFVAGVEEGSGRLRIAEDALTVLRDLAANPGVRLSGRAARRPLVEWDGGALTAQGALDFIRLEDPAFQQQIANGPDEALEDLLRSVARRELLVDRARAAGLEPAGPEEDVIASNFATQIRDAARRIGLFPLDRAPGEPIEPAIRRATLSALADNLSGASRTVPLGPLAYQLREGVAHTISNAGIGRAVLEIARIRASRGLSDSERESAPETSGQTPGTP